MVQRLRTDVMDAALRQPLSAFDTQPVGQLISRVTNDTEVIKDLYVMVVSTVLKSAALIGAMLVAMFSLDWRMALVAVCIFPAVFVVMGIYQYYSTPIVRRVRSYLADINDGFNEVINGMGVIQQFRQQVRFGERMSAASQSHYLARMQTLRLDGFLLRPLLSLFSALVLCGLLMLFGFSGEGVIGVGVLYAFINYLGRLNEPLIELTSQQSILQQAVVAGERIFELMDRSQQSYGADDRPLAGGRIDITDLSFAYRADKKVLQHISLAVPSRGFVALVGHTGSGKSTLANLLMGYYPVSEGEVRLDGRPISSLSHRTLRQGVAMVQQDPVVIADSVLANVTLGRNIEEDAVWRALETVQLADLVRGFPQGIHTRLGEQGNNLSVGQKQLLAMARVLVQAPQILILDEPTANIDSGTEQAIQRALRAIREHTHAGGDRPPAVDHRRCRLHPGAASRPGGRAGQPSAAAGAAGALLPDVPAAAGGRAVGGSGARREPTRLSMGRARGPSFSHAPQAGNPPAPRPLSALFRRDAHQISARYLINSGCRYGAAA